MMTSAYILVTVVLILGGLLAVLGDRVGSKIGKKRLRLFNLRPRQTAIVVTILTGVVIAASSLALLFALSKSLRQGVFELDKLMAERRDSIKELEKNLKTTKKQKDTVEQELSKAKKEQEYVQKRLLTINRDFKQSRSKLDKVSSQLKTMRTDIQTLAKERQDLIVQRQALSEQMGKLQAELKIRDEELKKRDEELKNKEQKLSQQDQILAEKQTRLQHIEQEQNQLQAKIKEQDQSISQLDQAIAEKDNNLKQRESKLKELESQLGYLKSEVEVLEQYYQNYQELREKRIAIVKGQVLSFGAFRLVDAEENAIVNVIDKLLTEANRAAIRYTRPDAPDTDERVVKITKAQVEQLIQQLQGGGEYVVRVLSASNYVLGEKEVRVFADVTPNQKVYQEGQPIAAVSIDSGNMTEQEIQKRLDLLLSAAQFRARSQGVLGQISLEDGSLKKVIQFIEQINSSGEPLDEIQAIASETTYTAGPLKIRLVAIRDGKIVFST